MKSWTLFIGILAITAFSLLHAQERVNRAKLTFIDRSEVMTKATGWSYNNNLGEWVDYENVISENKDYKEKYKILIGFTMMSHADQKFNSIQTKVVVLNATKYYVIIIEKWDGEYRYPDIQEDWKVYKRTYGYIFSEEEYCKLYDLTILSELKTQHLAFIGSQFEDYSETVFLDRIQTELMVNRSKYSPIYVFYAKRANDMSIRFYLPNPSTYYFNGSPDCMRGCNFDSEYFETDFQNFSKILIAK